MSNEGRAAKRPSWTGYVMVLLLLAAITIGILVVLDAAATARKTTERQSGNATFGEEAVDPATWGKRYPRQYELYRRTVDVERTRHGGSESFQKLDEDPVWRVLYAGYPFGIDYREERGHAYMLLDQRETQRVTSVEQPGACLHCHAAAVRVWRTLGLEAGAPGTLEDAVGTPEAHAQVEQGFAAMCAMPYAEAARLIEHPVSCIDCHEPRTMRPRVSRPAFLTGIAALAAGLGEVPYFDSVQRWREGERESPYDPNELASRREMRVFVCAQCHVEYYLREPDHLVVVPWENGLRAEQIEERYDDQDFADWTHLKTHARLLKAQHPEFEMWSRGGHARAGVACADCHMPQVRADGELVSDHHVRSPLLNVPNACVGCHDASEEDLEARVREIQDTTQELMLRAEEAVRSLVTAVEAAQAGDIEDAALATARDLHRRSQWRLDFVASENSMGFHAPQEAARLLGEAIDLARQGEISVLGARLGPDGD